MANDSSNLTTNGIVMAALAVSGALYFYHNPPLHGARPEMTEAQLHETASKQNIEARLWQDPLAAIAKYARKAENAKNANSTPMEANPDDSGKCTPSIDKLDADAKVLRVMLPGGPYAELSEVRRRTRFAVLSGLARRDYIGKTRDYIGCWIPGQSLTDVPREIPYEWFRQKSNMNNRVLVLWLNENRFEWPLNGISTVLDVLDKVGALNSTVNIVGPYTSDALESMINEAPLKEAPRKNTEPLPNERENQTVASARPLGEGRSAGSAQRRATRARVATAKADPPPGDTNQQMLSCPQKHQNKNADWKHLDRVFFYSYGATTDEAQFPDYLPGYPSPKKCHLSVSDYFEYYGINFQRRFATDRELAFSIAQELEYRGIHPGKEVANSETTLLAKVNLSPGVQSEEVPNSKITDHVALISEWDTIYGRTIGPTMIQAFIGKYGSNNSNCETNDPEKYHPNQCPWAHEFKYLRGLDGALPRADAVEDKEGNRQTKAEDVTDDVKAAIMDRAKAKADEEAFDHPYGQGQQDYLRRLAKNLYEEDERLRRLGDGSRIKAIGVLGSDVFDKLLVLRALKPLFPQALFFTTDFDYTLTKASELGWTRNLLIASSFGPTLNPAIQCQIPPFRGSYETSAFLATQLALDGVKRGMPSLLDFDGVKPVKPTVPSLSLKARVFEIERTGELLPLPLRGLLKPGDDNGTDQQPCADNILRLQTKSLNDFQIQPQDEQIYLEPKEPTGLRWLTGLLGLFTAASLVYLFVRAFAQNEESTKCFGFVVQNIEILYVFIVLVAAAYLSAFWDRIGYALTEYGEGEPIVFLQGISLWPAVMLRLLTVLTSLCLIIRGWRKLRDNLKKIAVEMKLDLPEVVISTFQEGNKENTCVFQQIIASFKPLIHLCACESDGSFDVEKRWVDLVWQGYLWNRFWRVIVYTLIMFVVSYVLFNVFGVLYVPHRGELAFNWFNWVTTVDVFLMFFLLFGVADATFSFWLFVRALAPRHSEWPLTTKTKYATNLNMPAFDSLLDYWIDIDFIAKRSACIGELIYYPFVVVALMIVSRSRVLANFDLNWPILITQVICLTILVICALALRHAAEGARTTAKEAITDGTISENDHRQGRLGALLNRIGGMQEGAFSPITQQAPVRAVLLPLVSLGLTALTDYGLIPL